MSFGSPADHALWDEFERGVQLFPEDITLMIRRLRQDAPVAFYQLPPNAHEWQFEPHFAEARSVLYRALEQHGIDTRYYRAFLDSGRDRSKPRWWE